MTPHYADDWLTVYHGDARTVMAEMEPESVHCVVTSPPYWGLRDYGTATWTGGDEACDHLGPSAKPSPKSTLGVYADGRTRYKDGWDSNKQAKADFEGTPYRHTCGKCGAVREDGQLGLEPTPEAYVESMVAVFREVRRVLRSDGTVWLNLGDSLDRKQLVGIPWRVAFALQADGWYLRSDIIWSKPNPMPESVTDRPTKSHEYLFLLSKSSRYFFDADAVREPPTGSYSNGRVMTWDERKERGEAARYAHLDYEKGTGTSFQRAPNPAGRNLRSVWTVATAPYPGAHFATFPPKLIEPCIKAGTSERGVCPECGAPWERIVDEPDVATTTGWRPPTERPTCAHKVHSHDDHLDPYYPIPATVLDPFAGSGTTGMVAQSLSRRAVLIDLSMDYLGQLMDRNRDIPLGLGA